MAFILPSIGDAVTGEYVVDTIRWMVERMWRAQEAQTHLLSLVFDASNPPKLERIVTRIIHTDLYTHLYPSFSCLSILTRSCLLRLRACRYLLYCYRARRLQVQQLRMRRRDRRGAHRGLVRCRVLLPVL